MQTYEMFQEIHELILQGKSEQALHMLMQMQAEQISLHDRINILSARIQEFENILQPSKYLHSDNNLYWLQTESINQGPFCPHCYEGDGTLFRLRIRDDSLYCEYCSAVYNHAQVVGAGVRLAKMRTANKIPFALRT